MSRSFVTDMQHLIDPTGAILESIPKKAKGLAGHLGEIIHYVTQKSDERPKIGVPCWSKIKRKSCSGKIDAAIDLGSSKILWHCLKCGDHGSINHWQETVWNEMTNI